MPSSPANTTRAARRRALRKLAKRFGYEFVDIGHLDRALCHASTGNEGKDNYERLEFLGDSFLGFAVADALFRMDPEIPEGRLTETRASLVSRRPLADIARELELSRHLEVGRGLQDTDLRSERILADLVEAVLAAIYLDGGVRPARSFVKRHVLARLDVELLQNGQPERDNKSRLLHYCQRHQLGQPRYAVLATRGRQHEQEFDVAVRIGGKSYGRGTARSKRAAEKQAAGFALQALQEEHAAETSDDDLGQ